MTICFTRSEVSPSLAGRSRVRGLPAGRETTALVALTVLAACAVLVGACGPTDADLVPRPPSAPTAEVFPPPALPEAAPSPFLDALTLVRFGPEGQTDSDPNLSAVFSIPMRALGDDTPPPPDLLTLSPPLPGQLQWAGLDVVRFHAEDRWPVGSIFTASVAPGAHDATGTRTLEQGATWELRSPLPRVVRVTPWDGDASVAPTDPLIVVTNGDVARDELARILSVTATEPIYEPPSVLLGSRWWPDPARRPPHALSVEVDRGTPELCDNEPFCLVVRPRSGSWPAGADISVDIQPGFRSTEGPLAAEEGWQSSFSVRESFRLLGLRCADDPCRPDSSLQLEFNEALDAASHPETQVSVRPRLPPEDLGLYQYYSEITLYGTFRPDTRYTVTLAAGTRSATGQVLPRYSFVVEIGPHRPAIYLEDGLRVIDRRSPHSLVASATYERDVRLRMARIDPDRLVDVASSVYLQHVLPDDITLRDARLERRKLTGEPWPETELRLPLDELVPKDTAGAVYFELEAADTDPMRGLVMFTDLGLTVQGDDRSSFAWVTDLATTDPLADVPVELVGVTVPPPPTPEPSEDPDGDGIYDEETEEGPPALDPRPLEPSRRLWGGKTAFDGSVSAASHVAVAGDQDLVWLVAGQGPDRALLPVERLVITRTSNLRGHVVLDRALYRPGEKVRFKVFGRVGTVDETVPFDPAVHGTLQLVVSGPEGDLETQSLTVNERGNAHGVVTIPTGTRLGRLSVTVTAQGSGKLPTGRLSTHARIAEFRVPEFEVEATPVRPEIVAGEPLEVSTRTRFLNGSAMRQGNMTVAARSRRAWHVPPGHEGVVFSPFDAMDVDDSWGAALPVDGSGETMWHQATAAGSWWPREVEIAVDVEDLNRQTVATTTSVLVHPARFYLGSRFRAATSTWSHVVGDTVVAEVLAVRPDGSPLSSPDEVAALSITLQGPAPTEATDPPQRSVECTPQPQPGLVVATCSITADRPGSWTVEAQARDTLGNGVRVVNSVAVFEDSAARYAHTPGKRKTFALLWDAAEYAVGDTAHVELVNAPSTMERGIFILARAGMLEHQLVAVAGGGFGAGAQSVSMGFQALNGVTAAFTGPTTRQTWELSWEGYDSPPEAWKTASSAEVALESRRLGVEVRPDRPEVRPGDTVSISVQLTDAMGTGVPGEVTLWAVDEGVLMLEPFSPPDLLTNLIARPGAGLWGDDVRHYMARKLGFHAPIEGGAGYGVGGLGARGFGHGGGGASIMMGAASGPMPARKRFETTPFYEGAVETDANGLATVSVTMPDNLTRFRVFAMASASELRFGEGESTITVSLPLMARPALPRFAAVDDLFDASVIVQNASPDDFTVEVQLSAVGLETVGAVTQQVVVSAGRSAEVTFPVAAHRTGDAVIGFAIAAGGHVDAVEGRLPIVERILTESVATYGIVESAVSVPLAMPTHVRPDVGGLEVAFAATALTQLSDAARYLVDYPHGCLEQTSSRLAPLVLLGAFAPEITGVSGPDLAPMVAVGLDRLRTMQLSSGFSYWPPDGSVRTRHVGATLYATQVLLDAQAAGYAVDDLLATGLAVAEELARGSVETRGRVDQCQAYDVLARAGRLQASDAAQLRLLLADARTLPLFARAWLLRPLTALAAEDPTLRADADALLTGILNNVVETARAIHLEEPERMSAVYWASDARTEAIVADVLLDLDPDHPMLPKLVEGILERRVGGRWRNTQDNAWALRALARWFALREREVPAFRATAWLGDEPVVTSTFAGRTARRDEAVIPMQRMLEDPQAPIVVAKEGPGLLYYRLGATWSPTGSDLPAKDRGFEISRAYAVAGVPVEPVDGELRLPAGTYVDVTISLTTPDPRFYVAVVDPLPAGLEGIDPADKTRAGIGTSRVIYSYDWSYLEMRDDRVSIYVDTLGAGTHTYHYQARATTSGRFKVAPVTVEEMYSPEVYGRSASSVVSVVR